MDKRPTLAEVAAVAGVSIPTVSKVINRHSRVAAATREHVERVLLDMGYVTREELSKKEIDIVHVFAGQLDNEYIMEILQGIDYVFRVTNVLPVFSSTHDDLQLMKRWTENVVEGAINGIMAISQFQCLDEWRAQRIPFVALEYYGPVDENVPSIGFTNMAGGRAATQHLLELGHRRIGLITGRESPVTRDRLLGYRSALDSAGIPFDPELVRPGAYVIETGYTAALDLLALSEPPTAIFAGNDAQALGVYRALAEHGLKVPEQMSVVGCDDLPLADQITPPLTTIRLPLLEMGKVAARMMLHLLAGEPLDAVRIELPATLVERGSCAPPFSLHGYEKIP